jgi:HCOMODA/2-hydroxy-3-carboxy-muconic semialdehyde decarboxylase
MSSKSNKDSIKENVIHAAHILINRGICEAFGHVSARLPEADLFVITPKASMDAVDGTADLVTVDMKGQRVDGKNMEPLETWMHTCIYRKRPDAGGIARTHSSTTSVFSILGEGVKPVHDFGAILLGEVPVFQDSHLIENEEIGLRLADFIGPRGAAALLRGNGTAVLGKDIIEATVRAIYLEESAMLQFKARQIGQPIYFSEEEVHQRGNQLLEPSHIHRAWEHYKKTAHNLKIR